MVTKAAPPAAPTKTPEPTPTSPTLSQVKPVPATATQGPPKESTEVTKWLQSNDAKAFIDQFYAKGYYKILSVDDDAINTIVKEQPGLANALKNSLADQKKWKEDTGKTIPPPKLPASTVLDLSKPQLLATDGITFSVPKTLSVESTNAAIISPNNIKSEEWIIIARSANLLYAYDMDGDEPKWAKTPILDWKVPERDDFARSEILHGKVTSTLTYSDATASYVASGFDTETATAGYAFCAASFERSHKEKTARNSESKTLIQVGMWKYPRVKIFLDKCTVTSERFTNAVCEALKAEPTERFGELNKVFNEYGHVVPSAVLLGGQLCYRETHCGTTSTTQAQDETTVKAAVEMKLGKASASAGVAFGRASQTETGSANLQEFTSFSNVGGDSLLCTNPPAWAPTVKDPNNWAVIEMEGMRPVTDLLKDDLRKKVLEVWNSNQAILPYKELNWTDNGIAVVYPENNKITQDMLRESGGFVAAMRDCPDGHRGSVQLVSSSSGGEPKEWDHGTAAGAAFTHKNTPGDTWFECNSICLPVPQGGSFKAMFSSTYGKPGGRLVFIQSNLKFGPWECLSDSVESLINSGQKKEDGFLFVSIQAGQPGDIGGVKGRLNDKEMAGSYIHWNVPANDEWINQQNFCIPIPGGSKFGLTFDPYSASVPKPKAYAYWLPLVDEHWKMQAAVPISVNTQISAESDGILHGWIRQTQNGDRGTLKIYTGDDAVTYPPKQLPCIAASIHQYDVRGRWVKYSSVMLPVAKGTPCKIEFLTTSGSPQAQVFWTAIFPVKSK